MYTISVILLMNLVFFHAASVEGAVQFSFIPPPSLNIIIQSTAVFKCSVDGVQASDFVTLSWTVNGKSSHSGGILQSSFQSYIDSVGITVTGLGTHDSTLTIPGNTGLDGTIVECGANGVVDGLGYSDTSTSDPLYIDIPRVHLLISKPMGLFRIMSKWTHPTVPMTGLHIEYNVTTRDGSSTNITFTNDTQHERDHHGFGVYNISVAAVIDGLQGDMGYSSVAIMEGDVEWTMELTRENGVLLAYISTINNEPDQLLWIEDFDSMEINSNGFSADLSNIGKVKGKAFLVLNYNESQIHSIKDYIIDTFNVKGLSHSYDDGSVCFQCIYHSYADSSQGCNVKYSSTDGTVQHSFNISRDVNNMCINNISSSTYNITVYDMDELDSPAYQINNQVIQVPEPSTDSSSSVTSSTSETSLPTINNSTDSTPNTTTTTQSPSDYSDSNPPLVTIIIIGAVIAVLILIIFLVLLLIAIIKKHFSTHQNNRFKAATLQQDVPLQTNPCYQTVQVPNNRNGCTKSDTVYENIENHF